MPWGLVIRRTMLVMVTVVDPVMRRSEWWKNTKGNSTNNNKHMALMQRRDREG